MEVAQAWACLLYMNNDRLYYSDYWDYSLHYYFFGCCNGFAPGYRCSHNPPLAEAEPVVAEPVVAEPAVAQVVCRLCLLVADRLEECCSLEYYLQPL